AVLDLTRPEALPKRHSMPNLAEGATCKYCPHAVAVAPDGKVWVSLTGAVAEDHEHAYGGGWIFDPRGGWTDDFMVFHGSAMLIDFQRITDGYRALVPQQGHGEDLLNVITLGSAGLDDGIVVTLPPEQCLLAHAAQVFPAAGRVAVLCEGDHMRPGTLLW